MRSSIRASAQLLGRYAGPHRWHMAGLGICLLAATGLQLLAPQVMRRVIDTASAHGETTEVSWLILAFFAVALSHQVVNTAATYLGENVAWKATNQLRTDLIRHCLRLDLSFHSRRMPGELIERIDGDSGALANLFSRFLLLILGSLLFIVGVLTVLFLQDWRAGAAAAGYVFVSLFILGRFRRSLGPLWGEARKANGELYGFLEERIVGADTIRTNGAIPHTLHRFEELTRQAYRRFLKAGLFSTISANLGMLSFYAGTAAMMAVAALLYQQGQLSLGMAYLFVHYTMMLNWPLETITRQLNDLNQASASVGRVQELLREEVRVTDGPGVHLPSGPLAVEFDGVSFAYDADRPVLDHVTLRLQPGTVLGLLGRTGSGKSTLTRLLARLCLPGSGTVRLGGADIRDARSEDLAPRVGLVTQRVHLFHGTLRDNLTLFDPSIPDERIVGALRDLGLGAWYDSLPDGLEAVLAPSGGGLSAGEAQLLAFTRIFLKDPGLIILDEPTSRLDPATEALVQRAVERLLRGRTAIVIAHRLATVRRVDEVLIMENGRVKEHGRRDELLGDPGSEFNRMLQAGLEEAIA